MTPTDKAAGLQTGSLSFEFDLQHPPETVWRALTDPVLLREWLLPVVDLELEPGAAFTFSAQPQPGWDGVVNCRFLKPMDATMLDALARNHRTFVTVEEGTVVNGFGAYLSERLQTAGPETRVIALGVPDKLIEQAPRAEQLAEFGLTAEGIARRISALVREETLEAR